MAIQTYTEITPQQAEYLHFVSNGGYIDGKRLSHEQFASDLGVSRKSLYNWQQSIPSFWQRVQELRQKQYKLKLSNVYEALYKKALEGDVQAARLLFQQLGDLKPAPRDDADLPPTKIILRMGS
ncbi:hypothetical protein H0W80_04235 [Candidatus Saccharibacteria bacterium]|nr:hypothetical protein [Candidatus Saccharibacteria bacterium]